MRVRRKNIIKISTLAVVVILAMAVILSGSINDLLEFVAHLPVFTGTVPTPSMFPTIDQGDVIFVDTRIEFDDIMLGDIVVFNAPVGMTAHRVIGFDDGNLITQGDNNPEPDGLPITGSMYVGAVIYILEGGSYYAVLVLGCFLGWFARDTWLNVKRKRSIQMS